MPLILIRDATPALERLLASVAARAGHETTVLGPEATPGTRGDLLLLDPTAPGANGWVELLRQNDPSFPVVCIGSAHTDPTAAAIRPVAIVPKPFHLAELEAALAAALRHR